ncbi:MAG: 4'-phosphopantetheinyl transferase superfamily protein [Oscillospiraceae bacterium]|jgi:phosphopantetheinyl transferase|nr:4'-phosphopantetheinyl transferase superfamily protein [Oscillospiraceae bacterium]
MDLIIYAALGPEGTERRLARRLLALALERELGLPVLPEMALEAGGKPCFPDRPDICFNLSHSHGAAVCALHHLPVGIDVERLRTPPKRLAGGMTDEAFFRLWTAKEATIKRQGLGLGALLRPLEPDPLCQCLEGLLDGWVVTVCPSEAADIRRVTVGTV